MSSKAAVLAALLLAASCSRQSAHTRQQIALLPANILIADPASEWMRLAIPIVLSQDLATAPDTFSTISTDESGLYRSGNTQALRTTVDERAGRLFLTATVTDIATQQNTREMAIVASLPDLIPAIDKLANQIDGRATSFPTRNSRALDAFAASLTAPDASVKVQRLHDAIAADASFGLAYVVLIESLASENSPEAAAVLSTADSHRASFAATDRARFDLLRGHLTHAPLSQQAAAAEAVARLLTNNVEALATLGSTRFLQGNPSEGERMMTRALQIEPDSAVLQQQFAIGLIESRQFSRAEKILERLSRNPAITPQLAVCILLEGDVSRATSAFDRFVSSITNAEAKLWLHAFWQALIGNRAEAIRQLTGTHFADGRVALLAEKQVALWSLIDKRSSSGKETDAKVGEEPIAALLRSEVRSAEDWRSKVEALQDAVADRQAKELLAAYGLFLHGYYPEAAKAWEEIEKRSGGFDLRARTMHAASLDSAGKTGEARQIRVQPFMPDFADFYDTVSFAELRRLLNQAG